MTKPDFDKIFASGGTTLPLTDSQFLQGFAYLGENPPTKEEFNWLFQEVWNRLQWLDKNAQGRWQDGHTYVVGEICTPSAIGDYRQMECIIGGQSGTVEPIWTEVNSTITEDGGVTWVVRDRRVATARFDNSAKIATSNFVKAAGVRFSSIGTITATSTLDYFAAGKLHQLYSATAFTVTLPAASTVPSGETIAFVNRNSGIATIAAAGTDALAMGTANLSTIAVKNGETLTIVSNGMDAWFVAGSTAHLGKIEGFGSFLEASGYQKLPSGLIIQWCNMHAMTSANGDAVVWPVAFPTACLIAIATDSGSDCHTCAFTQITCTGGTLYSRTLDNVICAGGSRYIAIGY